MWKVLNNMKSIESLTTDTVSNVKYTSTSSMFQSDNGAESILYPTDTIFE